MVVCIEGHVVVCIEGGGWWSVLRGWVVVCIEGVGGGLY